MMSSSGNRKTRAIWEPRWTRPAIVPGRGAFDVIMEKRPAGRAGGLLSAGSRGYPLPPASEIEPLPGGRHVRRRFEIPADTPPGLYDLELHANDGPPEQEPHCVWVVSRMPAEFTFVHVSDLHVAAPGKDGMRDQSQQISNLMRHLQREVRPHFILNTGDLVSRYGVRGEPLPPDNVNRQIRQAREILLSFRIPHFLTPGNHDVAFPFIRQAWYLWMGGHWTGERDDYSFDYGGAHFIGLDRSVEYDEQQHRALDTHLTERQRQWLATDLESAAGADRIFLFCHYDYTRELLPILHNRRIDMVFYGHSSKSWLPDEFRAHDGGLRSAAYQSIEVSEGEMTCSPGKRLSEFMGDSLRGIA